MDLTDIFVRAWLDLTMDWVTGGESEQGSLPLKFPPCLHVWLVVPLAFNRMLWAELFSPKIHVKVLTPGILERDPVWKWVFAEVINKSGHETGA